jgi:integrase
MRVGEALAMKWENFDFNDWTYYIKENRVEGRLDTPKTKESKRLIKIPYPLQIAIEKHKKYSFMKSEFVFLNYYGKPYHKSSTIIKNYWRPALKELGLRYRVLYQLRHTHAILSLIAGDNPHDVAKRLGHKDLKTLFTRYAKFLKSTFKPTNLETFLNIDSNKKESVSIASASKH